MDETVSKCELDFCILLGLLKGQTVSMVSKLHKGVMIYAEDMELHPLGTQNLKIEDVEEELNKIPDKILKYISAVVLSPFSAAMDQYLQIRRGSGRTFATSLYQTGEIVIFQSPDDRETMKQRIIADLTILHEIGHIIDGRNKTEEKSFSRGAKWIAAWKQDGVKNRHQYLGYVSVNAGSLKSMSEDFADAFAMFVSQEGSFKQKFPNRARILEELNVYNTQN